MSNIEASVEVNTNNPRIKNVHHMMGNIVCPKDGFKLIVKVPYKLVFPLGIYLGFYPDYDKTFSSSGTFVKEKVVVLWSCIHHHCKNSTKIVVDHYQKLQNVANTW